MFILKLAIKNEMKRISFRAFLNSLGPRAFSSTETGFPYETLVTKIKLIYHHQKWEIVLVKKIAASLIHCMRNWKFIYTSNFQCLLKCHSRRSWPINVSFFTFARRKWIDFMKIHFLSGHPFATSDINKKRVENAVNYNLYDNREA